MTNKQLTALSDPGLLAIREHHIARLARVFAGVDDCDRAFVLCGAEQRLDGARSRNPLQEVENGLKALAAQSSILRNELVFRPLTLECDIYGVHFVDKILGTDVFDLDGSWQVRLLKQPIGQLEPPDLDRDPTWRRAQAIAEAFVGLSLPVPFFGLPTIASALNVGVNLFGQELLVALLAEPEAARHDLHVINMALCAMHRWYQKAIPAAQLQSVVGSYRTQPPGFGQLCGCTTQLVSEQQYRDFIAPLDAELLGQYPNGGMIHLCGSHLQHIPVWQKTKSLRAIQVNDQAANDLERYWVGLRDDQIIYVNPTPYMTLDRIMSITGGHRVVIVSNVEDTTQIRKRSVA